jgi:microsomal dipeptidase-like Zn-dependent dipeptidase
MHIEGAEAIEAGLGNLPGLHARGLRSLGITWSRPNAFGHGVPFAAPASPDMALGSDFDGCELPEGIEGAEGLQDVLGGRPRGARLERGRRQ